MRVRQVSPWAATCALSLLCVSAGADTLQTGDPATLFTLTDAVSGLDAPTSFAWLPDGRMVITQKGNGNTADALIADKTGVTKVIGTFQVNSVSEQGLLHVIVHPDFATNHLLIFYYSAGSTNKDPGTDNDRHRVVTIPLLATDLLDMANEKILVRGLHGPANHDGGALAIGPDGKLYIGDGDTGNNSNKAPEPIYVPTNFNATCLTNPNGKILRVNLDGTIPSDNPLVGKTVTACPPSGDRTVDPTTVPTTTQAREDIWAWGFRNPWRFWFDPKTKNLWVGDVGEITYEELDIIPPTGGGKHYGWPYREGAKGHPVTACDAILPTKADCIDPQYYCKHGAGVTGIDGNCSAIMGGLIVDSCQFPASFRGRYFFADASSHWVATLQPTSDRNGVDVTTRQMFAASTEPVHLDVGPDGALYYAVINAAGSGVIERVFPKNPVACSAQPGTGGTSGTDAGADAGGIVSGAGGAVASGGTSGGAAAAGGGIASGAGGASGGSGVAGASATTGGPDASQKPDAGLRGARSGDAGGCGCRTSPDSRPPIPAMFGLALGAGLLRRRRTGRISRRP